MITQEQVAVLHEHERKPSANDSDRKPRRCATEDAAPTTGAPWSQPPAIAAIIAVGRLLRGASNPHDVFAQLVELIAEVVPIDALAIVTTRPADKPLVWTDSAAGVDAARLTAVATLGLDHFRGELSFDDFEGGAAAMSREWLSLPITGDDGVVLGLVALVPVSLPDETVLAFVSSVARYLAHVLERGDELRHILSAREHAEWLARTTDRRLVEERRARASAEASARALRVASDATAALLSSFDYHAALRHVVRIIAGEMACGCVIDLDENGHDRIAHTPTRSESEVALALDPLVAEVTRCQSTVAASEGATSASEGDAQARAAAWGARSILDVDWIVSVPMSADGAASRGVLTVFGTAAQDPPVAISAIEELARRAAIAVENGRLYAAATAEVKQREQVLSMVSHDLKNSFSVIIMSVERILERVPRGERRERGRPQLELIQRSARRMLKLVADLLDAAALDAGQVSMSPRSCLLRSLVFEAIDELAPQAKAVGVDLVCEVETGQALADAHRLGQVLANLIGNAIKFTPEGGTVTVRAEAIDTTQIAVSVTDTGIGIPAEHLARIFDRFWQGPTGTRGGAGLGLAICRGLVERSGGRIWADSTLGVGTTVTFTLPIAPPRAAAP